MERPELEARRRRESGKEAARKLRASGHVPAVCYRKGIEPIPLSLEKKSLEKILLSEAGQNVLIQLRIRDTKDPERNEAVILKEIQRDPFSAIIHVDFLAVKMDETITIEVPVRMIGEPLEAVRAGGLVQQLRRFLEVECLPGSMPEHIDVDVSALKMGESIHVEQIQVPEGIRVLTDMKEPVVVITAPAAEVEEVKPVEEEEVAEAVTEAPVEEPK